MDTDDIQLQKIIAAYTPFPYDEIDLNQVIKDTYVAQEFKERLADDICRNWPAINCTSLHNNLFVTLRTGNDILNILQFIQ